MNNETVKQWKIKRVTSNMKRFVDSVERKYGKLTIEEMGNSLRKEFGGYAFTEPDENENPKGKVQLGLIPTDYHDHQVIYKSDARIIALASLVNLIGMIYGAETNSNGKWQGWEFAGNSLFSSAFDDHFEKDFNFPVKVRLTDKVMFGMMQTAKKLVPALLH